MINVMAASEMLRKPNRMMERLFQQDHVSKDSMTEIAEMKEQVLEQFSKALENLFLILQMPWRRLRMWQSM